MPTAVKPASTAAACDSRDDVIRRKIDTCPKLASLQSVNQALRQLVNSEQSYNSQIAEIIRHDPSLTARLLRMVNSVYFGLTTRINNIEEAVFYLGLRQIRELSTATPILEELESISNGRTGLRGLPWREMWKHSIGAAIMTREILGATTLIIDDETDYIVGLLHNIGKVVMAGVFPEEFARITAARAADTGAICALERELIGWDHARIGGYYLQRHHLAAEIIEAVLYHNDPQNAPYHGALAAAVQVADVIVRHTGMPGGLENIPAPPADAWLETPGWKILYGAGERETRLAQAALANRLRHLPDLLGGLV